MPKIRKSRELANGYSRFIRNRDWNFFLTCTTDYELTLPSARRLMGRLHDRFQGEILNGDECLLFWVAEKYEAKDGHHTHGLIKFDESDIPTDRWWNVLRATYSIVSGEHKRFCKQGSRCMFDAKRYDFRRHAGKYCAKYLFKRYSDYDLFV